MVITASTYRSLRSAGLTICGGWAGGRAGKAGGRQAISTMLVGAPPTPMAAAGGTPAQVQALPPHRRSTTLAQHSMHLRGRVVVGDVEPQAV